MAEPAFLLSHIEMVFTICASGFSESEKASIASKVTALGGHFTFDLTSSVDLLICGKANTDKYNMSLAVLSIHVVTVQWLEKSVAQGHFIENYEKFRVRPLMNCKVYLHRAAGELRNRAKKLGAKVVNAMHNADVIVTNEASIRSLPHFYTEDVVVNEQWLIDCEKEWKEVDTGRYLLPRPQLPADQNLFLSKCIVHVNVRKESLEELKGLISLGGGTWAKQLMRCVTHVVADHRCEAGRAHLVSADWLRKSVREKAKREESAFPVE